MPETSRLTEKEKGMIEAFEEDGKSLRWIAKRLGRSDNTIRYYFKTKNNKKEKPGPKPKLSNKTKRLILRNASNKSTSLSKIKADMDLNVSKETIRKVLVKSPNIQFRKKLVKPPLTEQHKQKRLVWAKDRVTWVENWKNVVWSDEKKFNLDGPDGFAYYWHDQRKDKLIYSKRHTGGGSVMIWGCFNFNGKSNLALISGNMNQWSYQAYLTNYLLPFLDEYGGENPVFQQDNCRCHTAKSTIQWLKDRNIEVMQWPPYSPDLNPIENIWGVLARRLYAGGRQFNSVDDLKNEIIRCWDGLEKTILENVVNSMPERIYQIIYGHGNSTKY